MCSALNLLPAVDIRDSKSVRLVQGVMEQEAEYGEPLEIALTWQETGAEWVHLVDLDAAFDTGDNRACIKEVIASLDVQVQLSGGITDDRTLESALEMGPTRVNLSTAALLNFGWVEKVIAQHGDRIAVGLDVRGDRLASRGSNQEVGDAMEYLDRLNAVGCARYVLTDVLRDGSLQGPPIELLRQVCAHTSRPVIASGGIASLEDIDQLRQLVALGVEGAIVGKALYVGAFTLQEALQHARGS